MPLHLTTAFSTLDSQLPRHYPHLSAFQSNVIDSLHFAAASSAGLFPPPPPPPPPPLISASNATIAPKPTLDMNPYLSRYLSPIPTKSDTELTVPKPLPLVTIPKLAKDLNGKEDEVSSSEEILTVHTSLSTSSGGNSAASSQEIVFESAAKLLFLVVRWTKSIPSFNQLNANDQNLLLEECWPDLFIIMSAQYGLPIESEILVFLPPLNSFKINTVLFSLSQKSDLDLTIPSNEQAIHKLYKAIHQILLLRLNHTEIACLKTLILFRPGECLAEIFYFTRSFCVSLYVYHIHMFGDFSS